MRQKWTFKLSNLCSLTSLPYPCFLLKNVWNFFFQDSRDICLERSGNCLLPWPKPRSCTSFGRFGAYHVSHQGRPTRSDSGETGSDMTINRIISAGWSAIHDGGNVSSTITMSHLENVLQGDSEPIYESSQYDMLLDLYGWPVMLMWRLAFLLFACGSEHVRERYCASSHLVMSFTWPRYCAARDNATDSRGLAIPNWMPMAYVTKVRDPAKAMRAGMSRTCWKPMWWTGLSHWGSWLSLCTRGWIDIQCLGGRLDSTRIEIGGSLCNEPIITSNSLAIGRTWYSVVSNSEALLQVKNGWVC